MTMDDATAESTTYGGAERADLHTIRILGLPIAVQTQAQEHADELVRELTLIGAQLREDGNVRDLPAVLVTLVEQLTAQYSGLTVEQEQQLADANARGDETIDLVYRLPASAGQAAQALGDVLDQADSYCRTGRHLLTLTTPDELVRYRRWFLSQFTDQLAGQPPLSWDDYLHRTGQ